MFARSVSIFCCSSADRCGDLRLELLRATPTSCVLVLAGLAEHARACAARIAARRRRPPRRGKLHLAIEQVAELVARRRVVLVARVAEADLGPPHLDLPAHVGDLVVVALEVVLVGVELGLEPLQARRIARDALLRPVAQHPAQAVDASPAASRPRATAA